MATLSSIKGKIAEVSVYLGDKETPDNERLEEDYIQVGYRQHAYTAAIEKEAKAIEDDGRMIGGLVAMCVPVFAWWTLKAGASDEQMDLLAEAHALGDAKAIAKYEAEIAKVVDAQLPIPITQEAMEAIVPGSVLMAILDAIGDARRPNMSGTVQPSRKR